LNRKTDMGGEDRKGTRKEKIEKRVLREGKGFKWKLPQDSSAKKGSLRKNLKKRKEAKGSQIARVLLALTAEVSGGRVTNMENCKGVQPQRGPRGKRVILLQKGQPPIHGKKNHLRETRSGIKSCQAGRWEFPLLSLT